MRLVWGLRGIGMIGVADDELSAERDKIPACSQLYYLQMARLEAARLRLGAKPIFRWQRKSIIWRFSLELHPAVPLAR